MSKEKYKLGYISVICDDFDIEEYVQLREAAVQCEKFVVGIPDEYIVARLWNGTKEYNPEKVKEFLLDLKWVTDVIILNLDYLNKQQVYDKYPFDVCFYGTQYGLAFERDKLFCEERNIELIPLHIDRFIYVPHYDSLQLALQNVPKEHKIILYGTGAYFDIYMKQYGSKFHPSYAVDGDESKWNTIKDGISVFSPEKLLEEKIEDVLVVICGKHSSGMLSRLQEMGDFNYRTMLFNGRVSMLEEFEVIMKDETSYIKKCHAGLKTLMTEFDRVCRKNDIKYYLICGSLIGAIRHKGMIPWDDDLDVAMTRTDFDKLKSIATQEFDPEQFVLIDTDELGNNTFLDFMPRLIYKEMSVPMKVFDKVYGKATADVNNRLFIDIYVMDNAHDNNKKHMINMLLMKGIYTLCMGHRGKTDYEEYSSLPQWKLSMIKLVNAIGRMIPFIVLHNTYLGLSKRYNRIDTDCYFMNSCAITCIERKFKKEFFEEGKEVEWQGMRVIIPRDYDGLLHAMRYDDYMNYPPLNIRKPSHYFNSDIKIW